jgi:phage gpG-like protein
VTNTAQSGFTVRVEGARQLRASMKRAGLDLGDLADAHAAAAGIVVREAPHWIHNKSGNLADSIRAGHAKTRAVVRAGGSKVPYAGVLEWGWPARHIRPKPYLTTAAVTTEPQWTAVYKSAVDKILAKIEGAPSA